MYDANPTDKLYLATLAKQISEGLDKQIEGFVKEHWLIYNEPHTYVNLILSGEIENYLKGKPEHKLQD